MARDQHTHGNRSPDLSPEPSECLVQQQSRKSNDARRASPTLSSDAASSVAYHDTMGAADSAYRTLNDAPMLRSFGIDSLIPLTTSILTLGAMILVMVFLDWELALVALLVSPLMFLLTFVFRPRIRAGWRKFRASESAAMAVAQESLGASRLVKSYGQEERKDRELVSHYDASLSALLKGQAARSAYSLLVGIRT